MANKLRHIAISVRDPEKTAKFFEEAFGMTRAGNAQRGVYMTDGIFNVALLNFGDEPVAGLENQKGPLGLIHFGMWVDNLDDMRQEDHRGRRQLRHRPQGNRSRTSTTRSNTRPRKASCSTSPRAAGRARSRRSSRPRYGLELNCRSKRTRSPFPVAHRRQA